MNRIAILDGYGDYGDYGRYSRGRKGRKTRRAAPRRRRKARRTHKQVLAAKKLATANRACARKARKQTNQPVRLYIQACVARRVSKKKRRYV